MAAYRLVLDMHELQVLVERTRFPLHSPSAVRHMGGAVRKYAAMVQARAVRNVSGYPVVFAGGVFRVQVRTGALKGSIEMQWPYGSVFTARVFVNGTHTADGSYPGFPTKPRPVADYAGAIEFGHEEIDLKKTMKGKIVPFFASRAKNPRGPYAAGNLKPVQGPAHEDYGSQWQSHQLNAKLAAKGKGPMIFEKKGGKAAFRGGRTGSSYFIAFRRVGNTGWIIPAARPRPFMRAALEGTKEKGRLMMVEAGVQMLDPRQ